MLVDELLGRVPVPDIAMCVGSKCPLKESCYRFTAKPNKISQCYLLGAPYDPKGNCCFYYIPTGDLEAGEPIRTHTDK